MEEKIAAVGPNGKSREYATRNRTSVLGLMTGKVNQDQGQVGVVPSHTPAMVEVTYRRDAGGKLSTVQKRPSSLILLEPGLVAVQETDGSVWIHRERKG
jgi:hypothetical protein